MSERTSTPWPPGVALEAALRNAPLGSALFVRDSCGMNEVDRSTLRQEASAESDSAERNSPKDVSERWGANRNELRVVVTKSTKATPSLLSICLAVSALDDDYSNVYWKCCACLSQREQQQLF